MSAINSRTFASSAPTSASVAIAKEFDVSAEVAYLTTSLFLVGYVVGKPFQPQIYILDRRLDIFS